MLRRLGRFLQLIGLLILPVGMAGNLIDPQRISVWTMLIVAGIGMAVFALGWLLQQVSGRG